MKAYFTKLFDYDRQVNLKIAQLIINNEQSLRVAQLMSHLLSAQQIWLSRCTDKPFNGYQLWPKWGADTYTSIIETNYNNWITQLNKEANLERVVAYKNFKGESNSALLTDILAHVINHGTHHRAQIGLLLKQHAEIELPYTDYIYFALSNT